MQPIQLNLRDKNNATAFNWACWGGDLDIVKFLFWSEKIAIDSSSFRFAAERGHQHIISFLISTGLQIDYSTLLNCETIVEKANRNELLKIFR